MSGDGAWWKSGAIDSPFPLSASSHRLQLLGLVHVPSARPYKEWIGILQMRLKMSSAPMEIM